MKELNIKLKKEKIYVSFHAFRNYVSFKYQHNSHILLYSFSCYLHPACFGHWCDHLQGASCAQINFTSNVQEGKILL